MPVNEFDLIQKFFQKNETRPDVILGIGDDCAILTPPVNDNLLVTTDTLTLNTHFYATAKAFDLGHKAIAISLSDIAAMGGQPAWVLLNLTLPHADEEWLADFSKGFFSLLDTYGISLVGGNTSKGVLSITTCLIGFAQDQKLLRSGAKVGDSIYVTGTLGDAGLALQLLQANRVKSRDADDTLNFIMERFHKPTPRVAEGRTLAGVANSAIDISDGLAADLGHLLAASQVGATIYAKQLPLSSPLAQLESAAAYTLALTAGEDYELCFTVSPAKIDLLHKIWKQFKCPLTCIGKIEKERGLRIKSPDGSLLNLEKKGFQHF